MGEQAKGCGHQREAPGQSHNNNNLLVHRPESIAQANHLLGGIDAGEVQADLDAPGDDTLVVVTARLNHIGVGHMSLIDLKMDQKLD